jgi:hypothetical protein
MRFRVECTGLRYQAEFLKRLISEGATCKEIPLISHDREGQCPDEGGSSVMVLEYGVALAIGMSYLALHVLLYVFVLRGRPLVQSERGIFLYHFASAAVFTLVALCVAVTYLSDAAFATAVGLSAIHGIYSLSFLELWTLAEGSYSMSILTGIASQGRLSRSTLIGAFARIGDAKKDDRLSVLSKLSLARRDGNHWRLSARGRVVANLVNLLIWLAAIKKSG